MHRRQITRSLMAIVLVAVIVGLVVLATSGDDDSDGSQQAADGAASAGGTIVYAVPALPEALDTWPFGGDGTRWLNFVLASQLIDFDVSELEDNGCGEVATSADVRGRLAESWEVGDDGHSVTLKLRDTRSAYGNPLTAEDVKWSFDRALELGVFMPNLLGNNGRWDIDNFVTVVDPRTVRLNVAEPFSFAVAQLTNDLLPIWDSKEARKHATPDDPWATKWLATHLADFGPWQLESFTPSSEVVLKRNPGYAGERGNVDRVVMRAVPDSSTRAQVLQSGDADITSRLSYDEYQQLSSADGVEVKDCVWPNRDFLMLNQKEPALAKVDVRRAISLAIDREALVDAAYRGFGAPSRFGLSQFVDYPKPPADQIEYDPERAKQLLAAAGYPDGFDLNLIYSPVRPGSVVHQSAPLIQSMLGDVGIRVNLKNIPGDADFYGRYNEGNYEAALYSESSPLSDPTYAGSAFLKSDGNNNSFGYKSDVWDETLEAAKGLTAGPEQQELFAELADIYANDVPIVLLVDAPSVVAVRSDISGYNARPQGEFIVPSDLSKDAPGS